jgi:hypothetical protein
MDPDHATDGHRDLVGFLGRELLVVLAPGGSAAGLYGALVGRRRRSVLFDPSRALAPIVAGQLSDQPVPRYRPGGKVLIIPCSRSLRSEFAPRLGRAAARSPRRAASGRSSRPYPGGACSPAEP